MEKRATSNVKVEFDLRVSSLEAIRRAAAEMTGNIGVRIRMVAESRAIIEITNSSNCAPAVDCELRRKVLDHQVRLDTANDYRVIREIIVAHAFEPCENVQEVLKNLEP